MDIIEMNEKDLNETINCIQEYNELATFITENEIGLPVRSLRVLSKWERNFETHSNYLGEFLLKHISMEELLEYQKDGHHQKKIESIYNVMIKSKDVQNMIGLELPVAHQRVSGLLSYFIVKTRAKESIPWMATTVLKELGQMSKRIHDESS